MNAWRVMGAVVLAAIVAVLAIRHARSRSDEGEAGGLPPSDVAPLSSPELTASPLDKKHVAEDSESVPQRASHSEGGSLQIVSSSGRPVQNARVAFVADGGGGPVVMSSDENGRAGRHLRPASYAVDVWHPDEGVASARVAVPGHSTIVLRSGANIRLLVRGYKADRPFKLRLRHTAADWTVTVESASLSLGTLPPGLLRISSLPPAVGLKDAFWIPEGDAFDIEIEAPSVAQSSSVLLKQAGNVSGEWSLSYESTGRTRPPETRSASGTLQWVGRFKRGAYRLDGPQGAPVFRDLGAAEGESVEVDVDAGCLVHLTGSQLPSGTSMYFVAYSGSAGYRLPRLSSDLDSVGARGCVRFPVRSKLSVLHEGVRVGMKYLVPSNALVALEGVDNEHIVAQMIQTAGPDQSLSFQVKVDPSAAIDVRVRGHDPSPGDAVQLVASTGLRSPKREFSDGSAVFRGLPTDFGGRVEAIAPLALSARAAVVCNGPGLIDVLVELQSEPDRVRHQAQVVNSSGAPIPEAHVRWFLRGGARVDTPCDGEGRCEAMLDQDALQVVAAWAPGFIAGQLQGRQVESSHALIQLKRAASVTVSYNGASAGALVQIRLLDAGRVVREADGRSLGTRVEIQFDLMSAGSYVVEALVDGIAVASDAIEFLAEGASINVALD